VNVEFVDIEENLNVLARNVIVAVTFIYVLGDVEF
jgi:hypothetical protein